MLMGYKNIYQYFKGKENLIRQNQVYQIMKQAFNSASKWLSSFMDRSVHITNKWPFLNLNSVHKNVKDSNKFLQVDKNVDKKRRSSITLPSKNSRYLRCQNTTDKSLGIKKVIDKNKILVLLAPRRTGKSSFLRMLQDFYNMDVIKKRQPWKDQRLLTYFEGIKDFYGYTQNGLNIAKDSQWETKYKIHQGEHPVLYLDWTHFSHTHFIAMKHVLAREMRSLFESFPFLQKDVEYSLMLKRIKSINFQTSQQQLQQIDISESLRCLTQCLYRYFNKKVVILIDQHDCPLNYCLINEYRDRIYQKISKDQREVNYAKTLAMLQEILTKAFNNNDALEKAVLTGSLNNFAQNFLKQVDNMQVFSSIDNDNQFGFVYEFSQKELDQIIDQTFVNDQEHKYGIEHLKKVCKKIHNNGFQGYCQDRQVTYHPMTIIDHLRDCQSHQRLVKFQPILGYSRYTTMVQIFFKKPTMLQQKLKLLSYDNQEELTKIKFDPTFNICRLDMNSAQSIRSNYPPLLFYTGYLFGYIDERKENFYAKAPNPEMKKLYIQLFRDWGKSMKMEQSQICLKSSKEIMKEFSRAIETVQKIQGADQLTEKIVKNIIAYRFWFSEDEQYKIFENKSKHPKRVFQLFYPKETSTSKTAFIHNYKKVEIIECDKDKKTIEETKKVVRERNHLECMKQIYSEKYLKEIYLGEEDVKSHIQSVVARSIVVLQGSRTKDIQVYSDKALREFSIPEVQKMITFFEKTENKKALRDLQTIEEVDSFVKNVLETTTE